jgi:hypothetical protein
VLYTPPMATADEIRAKLRAAGTERENADAAKRAATTKIRKLVRPALAKGISKMEIHRLSKVSRPAIDEFADEEC